MQIITQPTVHLVSASTLDLDATKDFLKTLDVESFDTSGTDTDVIPELGGRLCYVSFKRPRPGGNEAYIRHILQEGHGSVLEHSTFGLIFQGVSRSLTHELVRHRVGMSYSQVSQRFVDESDCSFVAPVAFLDEVRGGMAYFESRKDEYHFDDYTDAWGRTGIRTDTPEEMRAAVRGLRWLAAMEAGTDQYKWMSDCLFAKYADIPDTTARRKAAREAARSVLPNCTETKIFVTGNGRSWRHFLEMRGSLGADAEIRRLTLAVLPVLRGVSPVLFGDYEVRTSEDGIEYIHTDYRKV